MSVSHFYPTQLWCRIRRNINHSEMFYNANYQSKDLPLIYAISVMGWCQKYSDRLWTRRPENIFSTKRSLNFQNVKNKMRFLVECLSCTILECLIFISTQELHRELGRQLSNIKMHQKLQDVMQIIRNFAFCRVDSVLKYFSLFESFCMVTGDDYGCNKRRP